MANRRVGATQRREVFQGHGAGVCAGGHGGSAATGAPPSRSKPSSPSRASRTLRRSRPQYHSPQNRTWRPGSARAVSVAPCPSRRLKRRPSREAWVVLLLATGTSQGGRPPQRSGGRGAGLRGSLCRQAGFPAWRAEARRKVHAEACCDRRRVLSGPGVEIVLIALKACRGRRHKVRFEGNRVAVLESV